VTPTPADEIELPVPLPPSHSNVRNDADRAPRGHRVAVDEPRRRSVPALSMKHPTPLATIAWLGPLAGSPRGI
jgi:hypothetical protein